MVVEPQRQWIYVGMWKMKMEYLYKYVNEFGFEPVNHAPSNTVSNEVLRWIGSIEVCLFKNDAETRVTSRKVFIVGSLNILIPAAKHVQD